MSEGGPACRAMRRPQWRAACVLTLLVTLPAASTALAQAPKPQTSPVVVDSLPSGSTLAALRELERAAAAAPKDAARWYEYGRVASTASRPFWRTSRANTPQTIALTMAADSSLARATLLAPDSVRYLNEYARFVFGTRATGLPRVMDLERHAVDIATQQGATAAAADAADRLGMMVFRQYETVALRRGFKPPVDVDRFLENNAAFADFLELSTYELRPPLGEAPFVEAQRYFNLAQRLAPQLEAPLRHALMMLALKARWEEMSSLSRNVVVRHPQLAWAWFGLGLAETRLNHTGPAAAAFDSALARSSAPEQRRLANVARLLKPGQVKSYDTLSATNRPGFDRLFWTVANPSLLIPGNLLRSEFLARVTYAELCFTDDEQNVHGADTDRGEVYIRYGPPDVATQFEFNPTTDANLTIAWLYRSLGLHFLFKQMPMYGTAHLGADYITYMLEPARIQAPVAWLNQPLMRDAPTAIPLQAARFRGSGTSDSADVVVYSQIQTGRLAAQLPRADTADIALGVFALRSDGNPQLTGTRKLAVSTHDTLATSLVSFRQRVPRAAVAVRVDALESTRPRAAHGVQELHADSLRGFGVSDVLLSGSITQAAAGNAERWLDFEIAPTAVLEFSKRKPVDVLWETYQLADSAGSAHYRVSLSIERMDRSPLGRAIASIISGVGRLGGVTSHDATSITTTFDRTVRGSPVVVDQLRLDMGTLPPGKYQLTVQVLDVISNRNDRTVRAFELRG